MMISEQSEKCVDIAEAYYKAMAAKDIAELEKYLHSDIQFIGPLARISGRQAVLDATPNFMSLFRTLTIRAKSGSKDQAMLAYDLDCPDPIGVLRVASLITVKDGLVIRIEIFFDARPFHS